MHGGGRYTVCKEGKAPQQPAGGFNLRGRGFTTAAAAVAEASPVLIDIQDLPLLNIRTLPED